MDAVIVARVGSVVRTHYVQRFDGIRNTPEARAVTDADGPAGIFLTADVRQTPSGLGAPLAVETGYLITDTPCDDARMILVAPYHCTQVVLGPFVEKVMVRVRHLASEPLVERFIHDKQSHLVA